MATLLDSAVLVLDRTYQPVQVVSVRRAFCLLMRDVARAVGLDLQSYGFGEWLQRGQNAAGEVVHTPRYCVPIPRVVQVVSVDRLPRPLVHFSRQNVFVRDGNTCQYCGRTLPRQKLNIDHVIPKSQGGLTTWENVVCSCVLCNRKKGGRSPRQAGLKLARTPARPVWTPLFRSAGQVLYDEWRSFLVPYEAQRKPA